MRLFYVIFILTSSAYANSLDLNKFISLSLKNDPSFANVEASNKALEYLVDSGLPSREFTLSFVNENGYNADTDENTTLISALLEKSIIETGTDFSISHSRVTRPDRRENVTQIRLEQSLYKNAFGSDLRLKKSSLLNQESLERLELLESKEDAFAETLKSYLALSKAFRDYALAKSLYEDGLKLEKNVASKVRAKVASSTDLKRAQLLVLLRKEELLSKKTAYFSLKGQIQKNLSYEFENFAEQDSKVLVRKLMSISKKIEEPVWEKTRASKIAKLRKQFLKKQAKLLDAVDSPDLSFVVGYNKDDSSRFSTNIERSETVVGIKLEVPIGNTQAAANYHTGRINHIKSQIQARQEALSFEKRKMDVFHSLEQARNQMKVDENKVNLTSSIVKEEERRFSFGRIDLDTLIELKSSFASYRTELEQSRLNFGVVLIDWLNMADSLNIDEFKM